MQPGQLTQTGQRDVPYLLTSCSAIKLGVWGQGLPSELAVTERLPGHQAVGGTWDVVSDFLPSFFFLHLLNCLYLYP